MELTKVLNYITYKTDFVVEKIDKAICEVRALNHIPVELIIKYDTSGFVTKITYSDTQLDMEMIRGRGLGIHHYKKN